MARVAYDPVPDNQPDLNAPIANQDIQASPEAFGGGIAKGLQQAGQGVVDLGKFYGTVAADNATNSTLQEATNALYGDSTQQKVGPDGQLAADTGYFGLHGADAMSARGGVAHQLDEIIQRNREGLTTPQAQYQYDQDTRRYRAKWLTDVAQHSDEQQRIWATDTNNTSANLALNQIARDPMNDQTVQQGLQSLTKSYVRNAQLKGEDASGAVLKAQQDSALAQLHTLVVKDPQSAQGVLDKNASVLAGRPDYDQISRGVKEAVINSKLSPAIDQAVLTARSAASGQVGNVSQPGSAPNPNNIGNVKVADGGFAQPATPMDGVILTANNLRSGYKGLTLSQIANKWAPASDHNNPAQWAQTVAQSAGMTPDQVPNLDDPKVLSSVVQGIGQAEKSKGDLGAFSPDVVNQGVTASLAGKQPTVSQTGTSKIYPSTADALNANMDKNLTQAQADAEKLFPNYPDAQERYVTGVQRRLEQTITQQRQQYEVDTHVVQQALVGPHPPITEDQLMATSPDVANAWRSVQVNNPYAAMGIERMFDANAKGSATNLGTQFNTIMSRVLAPTGDPQRITNVAQLWPMVQPGEDGTLTNTGAQTLADILGRRTGTGGDAAASQMSNFFKTAHQMISGSTPTIANPAGEKRYGNFLKAALPQISAAYKAGQTTDLYDQKGALYNSITNFMVPTQTQAGEYIYRTDIKPPDALAGNLATMNLKDPAQRQKAETDIKGLYAKYPKEAKRLAVQYGFARDDGPPVPLPQ